MNADSFLPLVKAGRGSTAMHGDHGRIAHAVIGGPGGTAKALCGTRPGMAASWSAVIAPAVTCIKCIRMMAAIADK
jgi:hypothetical protein